MATTTRAQRRGSRIPTTPGREPVRKLRRARSGRQAMVGLLAVFVFFGLLGLFGSKTKEVAAASGGYRLKVVYPAVTRPGLPIRWIYEVEHAGGFSGEITIATTERYLNLLDISPWRRSLPRRPPGEGSSSGRSIRRLGGDFIVSIDAATESGVHKLPQAMAQVMVDHRPVVQVRFKTVLVPDAGCPSCRGPVPLRADVTRALGRKELSEMSSFELILLVVMGDLIQQGVTGDDRSVVGAMPRRGDDGPAGPGLLLLELSVQPGTVDPGRIAGADRPRRSPAEGDSPHRAPD